MEPQSTICGPHCYVGIVMNIQRIACYIAICKILVMIYVAVSVVKASSYREIERIMQK